jgi:hypothetical protein
MSEAPATDMRVSMAGLSPDAAGITPPAGLDRNGAFLTDVIAELGFASPDTVQDAVEAGRQGGKTPERCLLESGAIDQQQLSLAVAERNGLDHADLSVFDVDLEAAGLIGRSAAARYMAVPIAFAEDGALIVAIEDPCDLLGVSDIEVMTKNEIRLVVASKAQIQELIERMPEQEPASVAPMPDPPEQEPEPAAAPGLEPAPQIPTTPGNGGGHAGELSAALAQLQDGARRAATLAEATEKRLGELEAANAQARQAATDLEAERGQIEHERRQAAEREQLAAAREQELRREVAVAHEQIATLEQRLAEVAAAAESARRVSEGPASMAPPGATGQPTGPYPGSPPQQPSW